MPRSKTKELARKLGVIGQKRKQMTNDAVTKKRKRSQLLSYLMVIDFESTCWENKKGQQEIIEFPAVLMDLSSGEVVSEFQQYVLPTEHPTLSDFCKQLTGITQEQVDGGVPIQTCLYLFKQWLCGHQQKTGLVMMEPGREYNHSQQLCSIATWSDWDLGVCLYYECQRKQVRVPAYFNQWVNIRALYKIFYERRPSGVKGSLEDLGMTFVGQEHSGIDDARNTAKLCYRMVKDGCKLNITKSIDRKAISIIKPPGGSTVQGQSKHPSAASSSTDTATTYPQSNPLASGKDTHCDSHVGKPTSCPEEQSNREVLTSKKSHVSAILAVSSVEIDGTVQGNQRKETENPWDKFDEEFLGEAFMEVKDIDLADKDQSKKCNSLQTNSHHQQDTVARCVSDHTPNRVVTHAVTPLNLLSSMTSANHILGPLPSSAHGASNVPSPLRQRADIDIHKNVFRVPQDCLSNSKSIHSPSTFHTPHTLSSTTSHTPLSSTLSSHHKVTPPMCDCGRRTKRKLVSRCGPNEGKPFYVCPISSGSSKGKGCGFFQWEGVQKENVFSSACTSSPSSVYSDL